MIYKQNRQRGKDTRQQEAERTIQHRAILILNARETDAFVSSIRDPAEPGPVLRRAAQHYNQVVSC